jgi:hypothetical protein
MTVAREPQPLSADTIEELADEVAERVVERLRQDGIAGTLVSAAEVARRFGISRDYIYDHAAELGAVRLGDGPRARLRFDPKMVAARLATPTGPPTPEEGRTEPSRRRRSTPPGKGPLLPIRRGGG